MTKENIPVYVKSELSKVSDNMLSGGQMDFILKKTPIIHLYERPAKGGGVWTYITGAYCKKVLNFLFGWDWDFEVVNFEMNLQAKQCIVHGRLKCRTKGKEIIKEQFGRNDIAFKKVPALDKEGTQIYIPKKGGGSYPKMIPSNEPLDLGNDLKGASTDALKKCASELGLFSDIYAPNEYKEIKVLPDDKAEDKGYWKKQISEQIDLCQDEGERVALIKDANDLDENKESTIEDYMKMYKRLTKQK